MKGITKNFVFLAALCLLCSSLPVNAETMPRLILQMTVDQLRGDMLTRFVGDRLTDGGFKYLLDNGAVFADAHHPHANTETVVGHVTLATGAYPADHGLVGNIWLDRESGQLTYNVEDARYPLLAEGAGVDASTEIDPTQKVAQTDGRSPSAILVSTFSDELALYTLNESKIFAVSIKDRGAISMAGHAGKAFWFSKAAQEFVTSRYYYDEYPEWAANWNQSSFVQSYAGKNWELLYEPATYAFGDRDDQSFEMDFPGFGRIFPHPYGSSDERLFSTFLTISPAGDEMTAEFAKVLIEAEGLGRDDVPDYLSLSFSSTDYVGHMFGPSSLESEDNLLQLDRIIAELFQFIDEQIGLDRTLIVLSADHGAAEAPPYLNEYGLEAQYIDPSSWNKSAAIQRLKETFGIVFEPYCFFNEFDGAAVAATHGSPWRYDSYVPMIFAGPGVKAQTVYRGVETIDVAPTLAAYFGIKRPSGSWGEVLPEVMPE